MLMRPSMYQSTIRGTSVRPARAAERGALPDAAGHQLERPRGDLLTRPGDADDDRLAPAAVGAFQRLAHDLHVADALEAVVGAAFRHLDQVRHQVALHLGRIDEMRHAEFLRDRAAVRVEVHADDHLGADQAQALDHVQPDPAQAEHHGARAGLDLRGVDHRADAGGDAAADVADLVERRVLADLRQCDLGQHGEVGEGRGAHIVHHRRPVAREPAGAVGHDAAPLRRADCHAQIGLAAEAIFALPAFRRVERDDVIAHLQAGHAGAHLGHDTRALMAEDCGEDALGVGAGEGEFVGVADAGGLDLDQHLARAWAFDVHRLQAERLARLAGHGGTDLHDVTSLVAKTTASFPRPARTAR